MADPNPQWLIADNIPVQQPDGNRTSKTGCEVIRRVRGHTGGTTILALLT